jgi:hypothetical protein
MVPLPYGGSTSRKVWSVMAREDSVRFPGRTLFLTEDPELLSQQLQGAELSWDPERPLVDNISTDELTPGWVCYYYDETLAEYCLVGLRGNVVQRNDIKRGGFSVIVSGRSKGCGSSRDGAVLRAEVRRAAGHREEHREDLRAERAEHRAAHQHRFRAGRAHRPGRGDPPGGVHPRARPHLRGHRRAGGLFEYSKAAHPRRAHAAGPHHPRAPDDPLREDHRVARGGRPRRTTASACPRWPRATRSSSAPTCASRTSTSPRWPTRSSARPSATTRGSPTRRASTPSATTSPSSTT